MSYTTKEQSLISGEPIELYAFNNGNQFWTYTCGNIPITFQGRIYEPVLISRGNIRLCANSLKTLVEIKVDRTNKFAMNFILTPIEGIVQLTIYRGHGTDPVNYIAYWKGSVFAVKYRSKVIIIIACPKTNSLKRAGLMRRYQRSCGYPIYSIRCSLLKADYRVQGIISSIDGAEITASIFGNTPGIYEDWLTGGIFELTDYSYSQMIVHHSKPNSKIIIAHRIQSLKVGDEFFACAGCNHAAITCEEKFGDLPLGNKLNYGGQEYIPDKNPFVGDGIDS